MTGKTLGIPMGLAKDKLSIQALGNQVRANLEVPATPITTAFRAAAGRPCRLELPTIRDKILVNNRTSPIWIASAGSTSREVAAIPEAAAAWPFPWVRPPLSPIFRNPKNRRNQTFPWAG